MDNVTLVKQLQQKQLLKTYKMFFFLYKIN